MRKPCLRSAPLLFVTSIVLLACRDAQSTAPAVPVPPPVPAPAPQPPFHLVTVSGDDQRADAGEESVEPLVVSLVDAHGRAVPGQHISWAALDGGSVRLESDLTDAEGRARAWWTPGPTDEQQLVQATSDSAGLASFRGSLYRSPALPLDQLQVIGVDTYEQSGQVVHPDVLHLPVAWNGSAFHTIMAITPYPNGNAAFENPSVYVSDDGITWAAPQNAGNPVVLPVDGGYLSDPALTYNPEERRLWMYYREVSSDNRNIVKVVTTADGVAWDAPRTAASAPSHSLISPSVVRRGRGDWVMFSVDGGPTGCAGPDAYLDIRHSADGIDWSPPQRTELAQPGGFPWHVDVQWIRRRGEFWALYNLKTPGSCTTPAVYLATSTDGVHWTTFPSPVIQRNAIPELADVVYRSSLLYTPFDDRVTFWFSGARYRDGAYQWSAAIQRRDRTALFDALQRVPAAASLQRTRIGLPNPEPEFRDP